MITDVCAGGVVFSGGKVLLLQSYHGDLIFPKGHVEAGEDLVATAQREVFEEAGLTPRLGTQLGTTGYQFRDRDGLHEKVVHWFLMECDPGTAARIDGREIVAASWDSPEEAFRRLTFDGDRGLLRRALAAREGSSSC